MAVSRNLCQHIETKHYLRATDGQCALHQINCVRRASVERPSRAREENHRRVSSLLCTVRGKRESRESRPPDCGRSFPLPTRRMEGEEHTRRLARSGQRPSQKQPAMPQQDQRNCNWWRSGQSRQPEAGRGLVWPGLPKRWTLASRIAVTIHPFVTVALFAIMRVDCAPLNLHNRDDRIQ